MMRNVILVLAVFSLISLVACGKVTIENYERLEAGMKYDEVESLLGQPVKCNQLLKAKQCRWGDQARYIEVSFIKDKAIIFSSKGVE